MNRTLFLICVLILTASCHSSQEKKEQPLRFFSDDSFWNQAISEDAEIDPSSDYWISLLDRDPSGENIGLNISRYTIPIYEVNSKEVPFQKVASSQLFTYVEELELGIGHEPEFDSIGVPIPEDMAVSPGEDMHVAIIDREANIAWDMFWVKRLEDQSWMSATGMIYPLDGPGVFDPQQFDVKLDESIHIYGPGVAAGMPIIAGVIRYDEVLSGEIRHKLAGALRFVAFQEYVFPAIWTDGNFDGGIPEGAVIQLNPELDLTQFKLMEGELVVAKALMDYGFVVVDFSAGSTIRAEYLNEKSGKSWEGVLRGWDTPGGIKTIPAKHYRVLKVENIQKGGDKKKDFFIDKLYFEGEERPN